MRNLKHYFCIALISAVTTNVLFGAMFQEHQFLNKKPVSFMSRYSMNEKDPQALLEEIIRFLNEEGLYDAAQTVHQIKENLASSSPLP